MPIVHDEECFAAGVDPSEIRKIANGLARYAKQAKDMKLIIFGGSGSGTLRFADDLSDEHGLLVVATIHEGCWDGGDGSQRACSIDGLLRGE